MTMPNFRDFRLGLNHVPVQPHRLMGAMLDTLVPPPTCDWHRAITLDGDALGNDAHSNCVPCGALRSIQIRRAVAAGDARKPTADEALALYRTWSGWDGSDATDLGTNSEDAAQLWSSKGVNWGDQWLDIPSVYAVNPVSVRQIQAAIAFLGPVQVDLRLLTGWQQAETWGVLTGDGGALWGYHRVCGGRYDDTGLYVVTWGVERLMTWAAVASCAVGIEATVSQSWLDTSGVAPNGMDLAALNVEGRTLS